MNSRIFLLATLLGLQLVLIGGLVIFDRGNSEAAKSDFLDLSGHNIDGIVLTGAENERVELKKFDGSWRIEVEEGLPADSEKIETLLNKLRDAGSPWPVGTTEELAERFEVSAKHFQRHIQLFDNAEVVADLFLGTSPGFRKVHARLADSGDTYAISFSNFEASLKPEDWLNKALLKPTGELKKIVREDGWTLDKTDSGWLLKDLKEGETQDLDKIQNLVTKLENLRITTWATKEEANEAGERLFSLSVTLSDGATINYEFFQPEKDGDYLVKSSLQQGFFKMALYNAAPLAQQREDFLQGGQNEESDKDLEKEQPKVAE